MLSPDTNRRPPGCLRTSCARTGPDHVASRACLARAGFTPWGEIVCAANDPELAPAPAPAAAAVAAPKPMTTDELQTELIKLDDMRKKGLLNDAEFESLKQKILSRF